VNGYPGIRYEVEGGLQEDQLLQHPPFVEFIAAGASAARVGLKIEVKVTKIDWGHMWREPYGRFATWHEDPPPN